MRDHVIVAEGGFVYCCATPASLLNPLSRCASHCASHLDVETDVLHNRAPEESGRKSVRLLYSGEGTRGRMEEDGASV
jgi:hypothetical protein